MCYHYSSSSKHDVLRLLNGEYKLFLYKNCRYYKKKVLISHPNRYASVYEEIQRYNVHETTFNALPLSHQHNNVLFEVLLHKFD